MFVVPQISLTLAAALALLNVWLSFRVGQVRGQEKVSVGDGGNERVIRRMRAHANFNENAWIVLALVALIELCVGANPWLWAAALLFIIGRIAHAIGMEGKGPGRTIGTAITLLLQLALAIWALTLVFHARTGPTGPTVETTVPQG